MSVTHDCDSHAGDVVTIGDYSVNAGSTALKPEVLAQTDLLVILAPTAVLVHKQAIPSGARRILYSMNGDGGVPSNFRSFLTTELLSCMHAGQRLTILCGSGYGRTGTVLAGLIGLEEEVDDPVAVVRQRYCPQAIANPQQILAIFELLRRPVPKTYRKFLANL